MYAAEIQDKTAEEVGKYYRTFQKKWETLAGGSWLSSFVNYHPFLILVMRRGTKNTSQDRRG